MRPIESRTHPFFIPKLSIAACKKNGTKIILDIVGHRVYSVGLQRRGV